MVIGPPDGRQKSKFGGVGDERGETRIDESIEIDERDEIENVDEVERGSNIMMNIATPAIQRDRE